MTLEEKLQGRARLSVKAELLFGDFRTDVHNVERLVGADRRRKVYAQLWCLNLTVPWAEQGLAAIRRVYERKLRLEFALLISRRIREERAPATIPLPSSKEILVDLMARWSALTVRVEAGLEAVQCFENEYQALRCA